MKRISGNIMPRNLCASIVSLYEGTKRGEERIRNRGEEVGGRESERGKRKGPLAKCENEVE